MQYSTQSVTRLDGSGLVLLLTDPREFFSAQPLKTSGAWKNLLTVSAIAAVLSSLTPDISTAVFSALVFYLNAVGMTCIFTGFVFMYARLIAAPGLSIGHTFTVCANASLGPILISWVPGAMWVADPWRWWTAAIGLSVFIPSGMRKTVSIVICALGTMYLLFRGLLSIV